MYFNGLLTFQSGCLACAGVTGPEGMEDLKDMLVQFTVILFTGVSLQCVSYAVCFESITIILRLKNVVPTLRAKPGANAFLSPPDSKLMRRSHYNGRTKSK